MKDIKTTLSLCGVCYNPIKAKIYIFNNLSYFRITMKIPTKVRIFWAPKILKGEDF